MCECLIKTSLQRLHLQACRWQHCGVPLQARRLSNKGLSKNQARNSKGESECVLVHRSRTGQRARASRHCSPLDQFNQ